MFIAFFFFVLVKKRFFSKFPVTFSREQIIQQMYSIFCHLSTPRKELRKYSCLPIVHRKKTNYQCLLSVSCPHREINPRMSIVHLLSTSRKEMTNAYCLSLAYSEERFYQCLLSISCPHREKKGNHRRLFSISCPHREKNQQSLLSFSCLHREITNA